MAQTNIIPLPHARAQRGLCLRPSTGSRICASISPPPSAGSRRLPGRRSVKKDAQAAWLLKAVTCIDLTTLSGDDTAGRVQAALRQGEAAGARRTFSKASAWPIAHIHTGAVCVYHRFVATAVEALAGTGIPVAAVSTGFPAGLVPHDVKLARDRSLGAGRCRRDRHRHHPRACAHRQLAGALRRDAGFPRGLRRGACEGDPRHRRPQDAAQCRQGLDGLHDGRRRFHQDLDRQGSASTPRCRSRSSCCA